MKMLITDIVFPNKYATWRNEEINYFLKNEDVSILIFKVDKNNGIDYEFDYEFCNRDGLLDGYNIMIFNPKYNYLDRYNSKIDGTKFNGKLNNAAYLLTKDESLNIDSFDLVYHIFSDCYFAFNTGYKFRAFTNQFLHLYPGAGFNPYNPINYNKHVNLICTHPITSEFAKNNNYSHVDCWTVPLLNENYKFINKLELLNKETLTVCFSSIGDGNGKGDNMYIRIVEEYSRRYPSDKIQFISIGNCMDNDKIRKYSTFDYLSLHHFYKENVDIYLNLETGVFPNGWPLGLEAMCSGAALLTTDVKNSYPKYDIRKDSIQVCHSINDFVDKIRELSINRNYLYTITQNNNEFIDRYINMNNQQYKIHSFIKDVMARV